MSEELKEAFVPNVQPKMSEKEQARLQAQIGNLQKVGAIFVVDEVKQQRKLETEKRETDLTKVPTVYFKNCKEGNYAVTQRTTKMLIENCHDCTIDIEGDVLTRTVEVWKCENLKLNIKTAVKTLQLDLMNNTDVHFEKKDDMGAIVWQSIEDCRITFGDCKEQNLNTGFKEMLEVHPDSNKIIDQFIIRFLDGKLTPERCVRLANGFLSTEREAIEWDKRNIVKRDQYVQEFLKNAGLNLNKVAGKKQGPNEPCACGSEKKYKKCCMNKQSITGLAPATNAPKSFKS